MRRVVFIFLLLFIFATKSYAYELILPREKESKVTTNYAFFVGKAKHSEIIYINDSPIYIASNGAFAHTVKLKEGNNRIVVRSNFGTQIYKFKKIKTCKPKEEALVEFEKRIGIVKSDNIPLRSTPIDFGLNRVSHLFKGTTLVINGSQGDFYRVFLSKNTIAWISKKDVELCQNNTFVPAEFITTDNQTFKNAIIQKISFSKNIPYTIEDKDNEIVFKVFNPEYSDESVYTLNIPKTKKYKYSIDLINGTYTLKVTDLPSKIEDCLFVIDAGHGGTEKGAIGCLGDCEKDINLKIALELEKQLQNLGANVLLTRSCDGNMSLNERVRFAKQNDAEIFISIHLNSIPDISMNVHKNRGTSVYFYNKNSKQLAEILQKTVSKSIGTRHDGVKSASFAVIRPTDYIGVLLEVAYMTNPIDCVLYSSSEFAEKVATGIVEGVIDFINTK